MNTIYLKWINKRIIEIQRKYDSLDTEDQLHTKIAKGGKLRGFKEIKEYLESH